MSEIITSLKKSTTLIGLTAGLSFLLSVSLTKYFNNNDSNSQKKEEEQHINSIEPQIFSLQIVKELKDDPSYKESRGYEHISEDRSKHHFTAGTLRGVGKFAGNPLIFFSEEKKECVIILHVGDRMCGHPGIVHGGLLSTIMDEMFARTAIPFLPDENGATAYLHVNFRKPCKTNQILIGRCKVTKLEGRKGFVEGTLETTEGIKIVDGDALFISLKKLK